MRKETVENITKVLPTALKVATGYFKNTFDKSGQEILANTTGTFGVLIQFFAQESIDKYFKELTDKKLEDNAIKMYLKASLVQVRKSIESLNDDEVQLDNAESLLALMVETIEVNLNAYDEASALHIYSARYHPIVLSIKQEIEKILSLMHIHSIVVNKFIKHFNENIEETISGIFGEKDYEKHLEEMEKYVFDKYEAKLLFETFELRKIGFKDNESLNYEETFGSWKVTSELLDKEEELENDEHEAFEEALKPIDELIEEYFSDCSSSNNCLDNILFTIADFGKGKSVFLKQYASKLAKQYSETKEGYFPIYFNLSEFQMYSKSEGKLGVIDSYLRKKYSISIEDDTFKNRQYIFLIDSLDESGELSKQNIESVINSVQKIQKLDDLKSRTNRVIITSRPFSSLLIEHIDNNKPFTIQNEEKIDVTQYISLYGFKKSQFNNWLRNTIQAYVSKTEVLTTGFVQEIVENVKNANDIDIYEKLLAEKTLSRTELRRPIFAYMIYQLIINKVDFLSIGKIGVYLSFINLLTKKAKHIEDDNVEIHQEEERRYRNILHSISALWMYKRQQGEQGILHKADICRVLEKKRTQESDDEVIERSKDVTDIEFLSNSYFGEKNNNLHFQHQSFAEILLAEYYLKVFIVNGLDDECDLVEARSKLVLGEPTAQTLEFFKELLRLLKETASDDCENVIEKRKLLYPLFASIATRKNNTLHSKEIYFEWFKQVKIENKSSIINQKLLENWVIDEDKLEKIIEFSKNIIDDSSTLVLSKTKSRTALFDEELTVFEKKKVSDSPTDIDKWLALVVGNLLHDDVPKERKFFNGRLENPANLFEMIQGWNYFSVEFSSPSWCRKYFKGIILQNNIIYDLRSLIFNNIDFSYSTFQNFGFYTSSFIGTNFSYCILKDISFYRATLMDTAFHDSNLANIMFSTSIIGIDTIMPIQLVKFFDIREKFEMGTEKRINYFIPYGAKTLKDLLVYGLKNSLFDTSEIKSWFVCETNIDRNVFKKLIDELKEFEVK